MTDNEANNDIDMTAEQAMNVVLQAEAEAKQVVEQCAAEAEMLLQQARQKAQKIRERTDDRIAHIHRRCSRAITDQVKQLQLDQEKNIRDAHSYKLDLETVDIVVEQIAGMLTMPDKNLDKDVE